MVGDFNRLPTARWVMGRGFSLGRGVRVLVPVWLDGYPYIQPTRVLVHDGYGHNWTAVSSNPDETGVKRMLSTRSSVLRGPKLEKRYQVFE